MKLRFWKLSGAGNDFVLLDASKLPRSPGPASLAKRLCGRRTGIGADGLLLAASRPTPAVRYFNADGSRAFCGNGARCAAWWLHERGLAGRGFRLRTDNGEIECRITGKRAARVRMPDPGAVRTLRLRASGRAWRVGVVDTGAPHAVVPVVKGRLDRVPVPEAGRALRRHPAFRPEGVNADFVAFEPRKISIRTYERGVEDETPACGTGAVAAAAAASLWHGRRSPVTVSARGGGLRVYFDALSDGRLSNVWLEGPAQSLFEGVLTL